MSRAIDIHLNIYIGFLSCAAHFGSPLTCEEQFGNLVPGVGSGWVRGDGGYLKEVAADVLGKETVGLAVADDIAA